MGRYGRWVSTQLLPEEIMQRRKSPYCPSALSALVKMNAKLEQVMSKVEEIPAIKNRGNSSNYFNTKIKLRNTVNVKLKTRLKCATFMRKKSQQGESPFIIKTLSCLLWKGEASWEPGYSSTGKRFGHLASVHPVQLDQLRPEPVCLSKELWLSVDRLREWLCLYQTK